MPSDGHDRKTSLPRPTRVWTVAEANRRIASLSELLPQLKAWVVRLRKVHDELHRLTEFWGREADAVDHPDHELKVRLDGEWQTLTHRLEGSVSALQEEGIEVKDLEAGLVDFYSQENGELVFLCWQRGEDEVAYYHALDGGYRNRRPVGSGSRPPAASAGRTP